MLNINKASRTICNESCQKSQKLQFAEIRKMVSVDPAWNILTCASQNMDEEMSKLLAVKIIQTYTQLMKMQSETKSILVVSLDNSSTLYFILDNSVLKIGNCAGLCSCPCFLRLFTKKKIQWTRSGQAPLQVGFLLFHLSYRYLTMSGEESSDQLPSSYLCLHLFASL